MATKIPPKQSVRPMLDPESRDWIISYGRLVDDDTHASTVLFLLDHQRGTSVAHPDIGSLFYTIKKILANTPRTVEIMAIQALGPLIQDKKIYNVVATAQRVNNVVIELKVSWRDSKGKKNGIRKTLSFGKKKL